MRVNVILVLAASICALTGLSHPSVRTSDRAIHNLEWGQPSEGLQMSLESTDSNRAELQVALRNTGDHDVTLNLGHMMANGKVQLPNNVELNFTDPQGKSRVFGFADKNHGFVGGRLDDYVVHFALVQCTHSSSRWTSSGALKLESSQYHWDMARVA